MVPNALKETLPSGAYPRPSITFTAPSRNGPIRSVCVIVCFSPDGRITHAGPLQTPSMYASGIIASRWAAMSAAGSGRPCAEAVNDIPTVSSANVTSRCLCISSPPWCVTASNSLLEETDLAPHRFDQLRGVVPDALLEHDLHVSHIGDARRRIPGDHHEVRVLSHGDRSRA